MDERAYLLGRYIVTDPKWPPFWISNMAEARTYTWQLSASAKAEPW